MVVPTNQHLPLRDIDITLELFVSIIADFYFELLISTHMMI